MSNRALSDIRIIDLTQHVAGPYCTKLLADYGADVIKIEKPGTGDISRHIGPFFQDKVGMEKSGLFLFLNMNKRGVTLNLKSDTGKEIFKELIKGADILVESFRPRVMPSLGLDYVILEKINPKLTMVSISNFGQTGPYKDYKASESIIYGIGGAMYSNGLPDREPLKLGGTAVLFQGGLIAAGATLGAFYGSKYNGLHQHVDLALSETQAGFVDFRGAELIAYQYTGEIAPRINLATGNQLPPSVSPCKDGYFNTVVGYVYWHRFVKALGIPALTDPQFAPQPQIDPSVKENFDAIFMPWAMERTKREICDILSKGGVLAEPLNTTADLFEDEHLKSRGYFVDIEHPVTGNIKYPGALFKMSETPWQVKRPAPLLGQHNKEIYGDLGYSKDNLTDFKRRGVI